MARTRTDTRLLHHGRRDERAYGRGKWRPCRPCRLDTRRSVDPVARQGFDLLSRINGKLPDKARSRRRGASHPNQVNGLVFVRGGQACRSSFRHISAHKKPLQFNRNKHNTAKLSTNDPQQPLTSRFDMNDEQKAALRLPDRSLGHGISKSTKVFYKNINVYPSPPNTPSAITPFDYRTSRFDMTTDQKLSLRLPDRPLGAPRPDYVPVPTNWAKIAASINLNPLQPLYLRRFKGSKPTGVTKKKYWKGKKKSISKHLPTKIEDILRKHEPHTKISAASRRQTKSRLIAGVSEYLLDRTQPAPPGSIDTKYPVSRDNGSGTPLRTDQEMAELIAAIEEAGGRVINVPDRRGGHYDPAVPLPAPTTAALRTYCFHPEIDDSIVMEDHVTASTHMQDMQEATEAEKQAEEVKKVQGTGGEDEAAMFLDMFKDEFA